jgi:hypothetical protein
MSPRPRGRSRLHALIGACAALVALVGSVQVAGARGSATPAEPVADLATVSGAVAAGAPAQAASGAPWTLLVYFSADTNLEPMGMAKLESLAEVAGPGVQILAFVDRSPLYQAVGDGGSIVALEDGDVAGIPDFHDAKLIEVTADGHQVIEELGEVDNGNPQTLAWFLWYGLTNYPAEHTAVVLWDHGGGATHTFGDDTVLNADGTMEQTYLSTTDLQIAMQSALEATGKDKFDLLMSDTCLNATFEVTRAMSPFADYMLASEEVQWMMWGWDPVSGESEYQDFMFDLTGFSVLNEGVTEPLEVGQAIMDGYEANLAKPYTYVEPPQDVAAAFIDLSQMGKVDTALNGFVRAMEADLATNGPALLQARANTLEFAQPGPDATVNANMVDLGDLLANLPASLDPSVLNARNAVYEAQKSAVIDQVVGPQAQGATGLSIYLPPSGLAFADEYAEIADPAGWGRMVQGILGTAVDAPDVGGEGLDLEAGPDGWLATLELSDTTSLAGATGLFGQPRNDGNTTVLGVVPATIDAGGLGQVQSSWSYQYLELEGEAVTAAFTQTTEGLSASVPGVYIPVEGDQRAATLTATLQLDDGQLQQVTELRLVEADGTASIPVLAGSRFVPLRKIASGAELVDEEQLTAIDLADFDLALRNLPSGDDFTVTVAAFQPDGSTTARSATAQRP